MVKKLLFLMSGEHAQTFEHLVEAANHGDGGAACRLGDMYREGLGGLRYSPKETFRWYARSAMAGDPNGQNNLGACYEHGLGCAQSYAKAVKWYRLSAAQNLGTASMNLGYCYLRGKGLPADKGEALRLFRLAVEQGEPKAQPEVERLESSVTYGRIPKGFKDRTKDGAGLALVGGTGPRPAEESIEPTSAIRLNDATEPGRHLGLLGLAQPDEHLPDVQRIPRELAVVRKIAGSNPPRAIDEWGEYKDTDENAGDDEMTFKRWVLTTWLLEKSDNWDCVSAIDVAASEVIAVKDEQTKLYGEPEIHFGHNGETVSFRWMDGPYAKVILGQKPCG